MKPVCPNCKHSFQVNSLLRCDVHGRYVSPSVAENCKHFEREPGADAEESRWCVTTATEGRGD